MFNTYSMNALAALSLFLATAVSPANGGIDSDREEEGSRFEEALKFAEGDLSENSDRIRKLAGPKCVSLEKVSREPGESVYRIWLIGGWGDALYSIRVKDGEPVSLRRVRTRDKYVESTCRSFDVVKDSLAPFLNTAVDEPLPDRDSDRDLWFYDAGILIIEAVRKDGYACSVRSINLTERELWLETVAFLNRLAELKWTEE